MPDFVVHHGDCLEILRGLKDCSIDAIVTDPPYGISFMSKKWDYDVPPVEVWQECLRVLRPGGHLVSFAGARTQHRMACRIEDAGFEIRDMLGWIYSQGFPKNHDVSKAIDKIRGAERRVVGSGKKGIKPSVTSGASVGGTAGGYNYRPEFELTEPASDDAKKWNGWGTALKPAIEPITLARKPLAGTVAANILEHGTGCLNIDGCKVGDDVRVTHGMSSLGVMRDDDWQPSEISKTFSGRWPSNVMHDGSDNVVELFPGKTSSFFYCPKASKADREDGLDGSMLTGSGNERTTSRANTHPTVKPTETMRWLCRLVTPPGGKILDPYTGSGSTGRAAMLEGFDFVGIEREQEYVEIARARIGAVKK